MDHAAAVGVPTTQVDSVYTRSTPMMEAVKLGRLDLIESLLKAGGKLDVQVRRHESAACSSTTAAAMLTTTGFRRPRASSSHTPYAWIKEENTVLCQDPSLFATAHRPQDVNGDTALHWAAREVSAAFLRQVLQSARKNGATTAQLMAALQVSRLAAQARLQVEPVGAKGGWGCETSALQGVTLSSVE